MAVYLVCDLWYRKLHFEDWPAKGLQRVVSTTLMLCGFFGFPIVCAFQQRSELPRYGYTLLGAECPTTVFTTGVLIGALPNGSRVLLWLLALNGFSIGIVATWNGFYADALYIISGIAGIAMSLRYGKGILCTNEKHQRQANPKKVC